MYFWSSTYPTLLRLTQRFPGTTETPDTAASVISLRLNSGEVTAPELRSRFSECSKSVYGYFEVNEFIYLI